MTLTRWKILVDILLFLTFLSVAITGLYPKFTFAHFGNAGFHWLHVEMGEALIVLILIHLGLNWRWVRTQIFRRKAGTRPVGIPRNAQE